MTSPGSALPPGFSFGAPQTAPVYVNGVQVNATPWDLSFDFQQLTVVGADEHGAPQVAMQSVARIVMSPQHAKSFQLIFNNVLDQWQQQHGQLPEPQFGVPGASAAGGAK